MNDKEILSEHGRFWLSENDERKRRIIGVINGGQEYVTLADCFPVSTRFIGEEWDGIDWSHQTLLANQAIRGIGNKKHFLCKAGSNQTHGDFPRRGEDMPSEIRRLQRPGHPRRILVVGPSITTTLPQFAQFLVGNRSAGGKATRLASA